MRMVYSGLIFDTDSSSKLHSAILPTFPLTNTTATVYKTSKGTVFMTVQVGGQETVHSIDHTEIIQFLGDTQAPLDVYTAMGVALEEA